MKGLALLFAFATWPLLGAGGDTYRFQRPVDVPAGWSALELPDDVLDACRPGLPDLRLMKDTAQEVTYAFERRVAAAKRIPLVDIESAAGRETRAIADRGPGAGLVSWLQVETPSTTFLKPIAVEASDNRVTWKQIAQSSIFATDGVRMTTVRFAPSDRRYVRISLDDRNGAPVRPEAIVLPSQESRAPPPREIRLPTTVVSPGELGRSTFTVMLPSRNHPLSAFRIGATDPVFSRQARIYEKVFIRDEISRRLLGDGRLVRSASGEAQDRVPVSDPSAQTLEIEVDDGDAPPLTVPEVTAIVEPKRILFYRPSSGALSLVYGSDSAKAPSYDLDAALADGVPTGLAQGSIGVASDSGPRKDALQTPARGASLDRALWHKIAPILLPDTPGVAYLELDGSLAETSSLRIVDGSSYQVPYVFEESPHRVRQTLQLDVSHRATHTIATLAGWDAREHIDAIEISVGAPAYFSRDVAVSEDVRDTRGITGRRMLGSAHWERRPDERPAPYRIALAAPSGGKLQVDIDDGDNAPLMLKSASIELVRRRIDFVFDKGDSLWVLWQNPEAQSPRYDLALLASAVLGSPALPAKLGPSSETPAQQQTSRWFLAAIVVAAVFVALALARTLRSLPN